MSLPQGYIQPPKNKQSGIKTLPILSCYNNNLERIETIRDDGKIDGVDPGVAALTGNIAVRYADNSLMNTARSGVPIDLELAYKIDADRQLIIECHEVYLPKPKRRSVLIDRLAL